MGKPCEQPQASRRSALKSLAALSFGGLWLGACGQSAQLSCAAPSQLTTGQRAARDGRQYVEQSGVSGKTCTNCVFYDGGAQSCGTCGIDDLPAHPQGYCTSWAPGAAAKLNSARKEQSHA